MMLHLPSLPLLLTFLLFLLAILKHWRRSKSQVLNNNTRLPPGPPKLPFIGHLHHLIGTVRSHALTDLAKKYGPIMHLQLGELPAMVISTAKVTEQVLKTHELNFAQRPIVHAVAVMPYHDSTIIFSPYNDHWRQMRKIFVTQLLCVKRIQSLKRVREEEVHNLIGSISSSEGVPINLSKEIFKMTNNIISRAICGSEFKDQDVFFSMIEELLSLAGGFGLPDIFPSLKIVHFLSGKTRALEKLYGRVDKMFDSIISDHKAKRETMSVEEEEEDMIDVLLRVQETGDLEIPLAIEGIKASILEFFGATSIVIATVTEWAMSEMARNPRVMEKAQAEVRQALKGKSKIDERDIEELSYLRSVVKETLRLHPPGPLLIRESKERCEINGYEIPAKTIVLINASAIGRDPECWNNAECFQPERFDSNCVNFKGTYLQYIPFGAGRRMCPGISFGLAIVELPLAQLLYHFNWELPDGVKPEELDMDKVHGLSPKRKNGLHLTATATPMCFFS
ncbi:hypothetical protein ACSBR1_015498 [Camellia fascicularis]